MCAPRSHIYTGTGCRKCANGQWDLNKFHEKAKIVHNDNFDYSSIKTINCAKDKIEIICNKCKTKIITTPDQHLNKKSGCFKCTNNKITRQEFIERATKVYNGTYDYSLVKYVNQAVKIAIICPEHGVFYQRPEHHLNNHECPKCSSSKGESTIRSFLTNYNILFEEQKKFSNCKSVNPLPFDFFLSKHNMVIEYNGKQHYEPVEMFGGIKGFEKRKVYDNIKNNFCIENKIYLVRIKYDEDILISLNKLFNVNIEQQGV